MPFLSILWLFTWKWSFAIFLDYHGPGHKQITKVRWVYIYFFFFFFFLVMSVVQNVTWKNSTIVSMEWCQSLFIETGWPVDFRPNHANLVQVLCQEPRTSKCESDCFFHLTSYSSCTLLFQTQCSLV